MSDIFSVIGQLVFSAGVAYVLFRFLTKKWIENKFAKNLEEHKSAQTKELENFRHKINTLFNRVVKIHEKEYEVLPEAWAKLHDAKDKISNIVHPFQQYPDFSLLPETEIRRTLQKYKLDDYQINVLISSHDRNQYFQERIFWQRLEEAKSKFFDFHSYIIRNRIFLSEELKEQFNKADDLLWDVLITREVGEEAQDHKMKYESYQMLKKDIETILVTIEKLVQKRLRYDEAF